MSTWQKLRIYLSGLQTWLSKGHKGWSVVLTILAVPFLFCLMLSLVVPDAEDRVRLTGMLTELAGLALVIKKLYELREHFGIEELHPLKYLRQFPGWPAPHRVVTAFDEARVHVLESSDTAVATATGKLGPAKSPDDRLDYLEPRVYDLENVVRQLKDVVQQRIESEQREREAEDQRNFERSFEQLKTVSTRGLHAGFLLLGVILATASKEIVCLLPWLQR